MTTPRMNILFVCMGNICRSPTAEGVFRQRHALQRGYDLSDSRARQIKAQDFEVLDLIEDASDTLLDLTRQRLRQG